MAALHSDADVAHEKSDISTPPEFGTEVGTTISISGAQNPDTALAILQLVQAQDAHHPIYWPAWKRWGIISIYCCLQMFVTLTSTTYLSAEYLIQAEWGGSTQVITLGQSLFILGNAVGPAFMGPLS